MFHPWLQFRCPDCGNAVGAQLQCAGCGRTFFEKDGIVYLLAQQMENGEAKEKQKQGWRERLNRNLEAMRQNYLGLPYNEDDSPAPTFYQEAARHLRLAMDYLVPLEGKRGLDLGAQMGWAGWRLSQRGAEMVISDLDDSPNSGLGAARVYLDEGARLDRVCADAENLPFADGQFDFVFSCACLHHLTDPAKALLHIARVLKPGGIYVAAWEQYRAFWQTRKQALAAYQIDSENVTHEQVFSMREYRRWFLDAGLSFNAVNPRWDVARGGRIEWGARLRESGYVPHSLQRRRDAPGLGGSVARFLLRTKLWRPLAHPAVLAAVRGPLLSATRKFRVMIGEKPA